MGPLAVKESESADAAADAGPYLRSIEFVYDNWNLIEEYENGQLGNVYFHGKTIDEPVALKSGGKIFYYHRDRLGSVTGLSDEHGRMAQRYEYGEYGVLTVLGPEPQKPLRYASAKASDLAPIAPLDNSFTYTGQYFDAETGLYYYKNRYYAPSLGQFTSKDPLGMIDGPNVYAYVNSNPLNWIDPMGTYSLIWPAIHEGMTMDAKNRVGGINNNVDRGLISGVRWNDMPDGIKSRKYFNERTKGTLTYESHYGNRQHWHSMRQSHETNDEVINKILADARQWYETSKCYKEKAENKQGKQNIKGANDFWKWSGFYLGHILHMVQDSYANMHAKRNARGEIIEFNDYSDSAHDHDAHKKADKIYEQEAVEASAKVISLWKRNATWDEVKNLLVNDIYKLANTTAKSEQPIPPVVSTFTEPLLPDIFSSWGL